MHGLARPRRPHWVRLDGRRNSSWQSRLFFDPSARRGFDWTPPGRGSGARFSGEARRLGPHRCAPARKGGCTDARCRYAGCPLHVRSRARSDGIRDNPVALWARGTHACARWERRLRARKRRLGCPACPGAGEGKRDIGGTRGRKAFQGLAHRAKATGESCDAAGSWVRCSCAWIGRDTRLRGIVTELQRVGGSVGPASRRLVWSMARHSGPRGAERPSRTRDVFIAVASDKMHPPMRLRKRYNEIRRHRGHPLAAPKRASCTAHP
jgi:hypothetical protein